MGDPRGGGELQALVDLFGQHEEYGGGTYCTCTPEDDGARMPLPVSWDRHFAQAVLEHLGERGWTWPSGTCEVPRCIAVRFHPNGHVLAGPLPG